MKRLLLTSIFLLATAAFQDSFDRRTYPPQMHDAETYVYKTVSDVELSLYVFRPEDRSPSGRRAAIVFFFGGGWRSGSPSQFQPQCKYLAKLGMVAIAADYRVASRHGVSINSCVSDAKSAIRWLRNNSDLLDLDPNRIVASGGSAGGHLAVSTALLPDFDEPDEDHSISSVPNALVLFNPAVLLAPMEGRSWSGLARLGDRLGTDAESISPIHHVRTGLPPTIIFHGEADRTVPFWSVEFFEARMRQAGNDCTLIGYEGKAHGFFNYGSGDGKAFLLTMQATEEFLRNLGYISGSGS